MATAVKGDYTKAPMVSGSGCPIWFHPHGRKMNISAFVPTARRLVLRSSAGMVRLFPASEVVGNSEGWVLDWSVLQNPLWGLEVKGRTWFSNEDLALAFGLSDDTGTDWEWLLRRYGGDAAAQGKFIRWGNFLNIPCPGTGHDGDPNISIEIDEEMKTAVRQLLGL